MGIFDPSNGANPSRPVNLVSRYQSEMQRAAYSPTVAQAAARSGMNPTLATRVAAREVAAQANQALPGLISQEAQMMEARRLENDTKDRQALAMGLNVGGQVLGTALSAYGGGAGGGGGGAQAGGGGGGSGYQAAGGAVGGLTGMLANEVGGSANGTRSQLVMPASYARPAQVPQSMLLQGAPVSATQAQMPSATAVEYAPEPVSYAPAVVGNPMNMGYRASDSVVTMAPPPRNRRVQRRRGM